MWKEGISTSLFCCQIVFCGMDTPGFIYTFTGWWAFGLFPIFTIKNNAVTNIRIQVYADICFHFSRVDTQEWNYCVIRKSTFTIFSFLLNLLEGLNCFPFGKGYHFISPPAVYESYSLYTCSTTLLLSNTFSFDYTYFREC